MTCHRFTAARRIQNREMIHLHRESARRYMEGHRIRWNFMWASVSWNQSQE
jgi:NOL1/NOP2/fmu family ribosome biogenesis protein